MRGKGLENINRNNGAVTKVLTGMAGRIDSFSQKIEHISGKLPERIAIVVFFIGHMLMMLVHEPWFDEALAWLIARDSSLHEILFVAPHYEGHPSLWHLVLLPFAKAGVPYEFSLSMVSLLFSGTAVCLFVYKSQFKRIIRIAAPFTYFAFYQYSVISRPYSMMMLAFVLCAITYKKRDKKPGKYILSLWFLCLTGAYGIVIAGGICVAWLLEMLLLSKEQSANKNSDNGENRGIIRILFEDHLMKAGKLFWLFGLLAYVLFILWRIIPDENAYATIRATKAMSDNGIVVRLLYTFFASLSDIFVTNVFYTSGTLMNADIYLGEMAAAVCIGMGVIFIVIRSVVRGKEYSSKDLKEDYAYKANYKKAFRILNFVIPYSFYAMFSAIVYLYYHHIGIGLLFIMYWVWTEEKSGMNVVQASVVTNPDHTGEEKDIKGSTDDKIGVLSAAMTLFGAVFLIIPIYWNLSSCIMDVFNDYGSGRGEYKYLSEHELDEDYSIFTDWRRIFKEEEVPEEYTEFYPLLSQPGVNIAPYLKKENIINDPYLIGKNYSYEHEIANKIETMEIINKIAELGLPDIIIGEPDFEELFKDGYVNYNDYVLVYKDVFGNIKKGYISDRDIYIYVRRELAEEKGLKAITKTGK